MKAPRWFEVDKTGLSKLLDRRGRASVILELIQNAWDAPGVRSVSVTLRSINGTTADLLVKDDSPEGFTNLEHAFTMFAESTKKNDPTLRGRFNLGEKLVLSICKSASIVTRKGTVAFGEDGTRTVTNHSAASIAANPKIGTTFHAVISMSKSDIEDAAARVATLFPPVPTTFNGKTIEPRRPLGSRTESLFTEQADDQGIVRRVSRETVVELYEVRDGETASLYELGIPVCETDDRWHVNIKQRVPLNMERDGVTPGYLRRVRACALEIAAANRLLDAGTAAESWVDDAMSDPNFDADTSAAVVEARFGTKAVIHDPSDPEANKRAIAAGYTVIPGGAFGKAAWGAVKEGGNVLPAGKVTPSPKPYSPDGTPLADYPVEQWNAGIHAVVWFAQQMAAAVLSVRPGAAGKDINVRVVCDTAWRFNATYGPSGTLVLNVGALSKQWFMQPVVDMTDMLDLLIHEFGHEYESDHLSTRYYDALTRVGARTAVWLATHPEVLREFQSMYTRAAVAD